MTGKWTWKMGKWTTSKLEQKATGPRPYSFKVLVDSHGFKVQKAAVRSRITLTDPNDVPINGSVNDALPGAQCVFFEGDPLPIPVTIPANGSIDVDTACLIEGDPNGPVTNTASFTLDEAHGAGPQPVSAQATVTMRPRHRTHRARRSPCATRCTSTARRCCATSMRLAVPGRSPRATRSS